MRFGEIEGSEFKLLRLGISSLPARSVQIIMHMIQNC